MSTDVDIYEDNPAVATERKAKPQRIPSKTLVECEVCGERVYFRVKTSRPSADPNFKIEYLQCPACGAWATRSSEVESGRQKKPPKKAAKTRVKYRYTS